MYCISCMFSVLGLNWYILTWFTVQNVFIYYILALNAATQFSLCLELVVLALFLMSLLCSDWLGVWKLPLFWFYLLLLSFFTFFYSQIQPSMFEPKSDPKYVSRQCKQPVEQPYQVQYQDYQRTAVCGHVQSDTSLMGMTNKDICYYNSI